MTGFVLTVIIVSFLGGMILGAAWLGSFIYSPITRIDLESMPDDTFRILCKRKDGSRVWKRVDLNEEK